MNSQERYTLFRLFEQNIDTLQGQTRARAARMLSEMMGGVEVTEYHISAAEDVTGRRLKTKRVVASADDSLPKDRIRVVARVLADLLKALGQPVPAQLVRVYSSHTAANRDTKQTNLPLGSVEP